MMFAKDILGEADIISVTDIISEGNIICHRQRSLKKARRSVLFS
jgi:hypothetical protein